MQDQDNVYNPLSYDKRQKCTKNTSSGDNGDDVVTGLLPGDMSVHMHLVHPSFTPWVRPLPPQNDLYQESSKRKVE